MTAKARAASFSSRSRANNRSDAAATSGMPSQIAYMHILATVKVKAHATTSWQAESRKPESGRTARSRASTGVARIAAVGNAMMAAAATGESRQMTHTGCISETWANQIARRGGFRIAVGP